MEPNTCLIFGEDFGEPAMREHLEAATLRLVRERGVRRFIVGPGNAFDRCAALSAARLRPLCPEMALTRLRPAAGWPAEPLPPLYTDELLPTTHPLRGRTHNLAKAVCLVLPQVGHLLLYAPCPLGRTCDVVDTARRLAARGQLRLWDISRL